MASLLSVSWSNCRENSAEQEIVWTEVVEWNEQTGTAILMSDPTHNKNLNAGDEIEINFDTIIDFKLFDPNGLIDKGGVDEIARQGN